MRYKVISLPVTFPTFDFLLKKIKVLECTVVYPLATSLASLGGNLMQEPHLNPSASSSQLHEFQVIYGS